MPEAIAEYRYDLADPPDSSSAWVEEICSHAIALKEQLGAAPDVDQNLRVKVKLRASHPSHGHFRSTPLISLLWVLR